MNKRDSSMVLSLKQAQQIGCCLHWSI